MKLMTRFICLMTLLVVAFSPVAGDQGGTPAASYVDENKDAAKSKMKEAVRLYMKGQYDDAIAKATEALALDETNGAALDVRAASYHALEEFDAAIKDYNQVIKLSPREPKAWNNRAVVRTSIGMWKGALEDYDRAITLQPDYAWAIYYRANIKSMLGDKKGALADCDRVQELEPGFSGLHAQRADILRSMGEFQKAFAETELELKADPKNLSALWQRGEGFRQAKEWKKALADFEIVMTGAGNWVPGYVSAAAVSIELGDKPRAVSLLATAIDVSLKNNQIAPRNPQSAYELACIYGVRARTHETAEQAARDVSLGVRNLSRSVRLGFQDWALMRMDPDLALIRQDEGIKKLLEGK